ncbi:MAG: hypothetical protein EPN33_03560 [Acidobacteria bacterium]|nr:MAG: hypothetical protein EPN33_03560 [Acidobacteriota bacterium]
MPINRSYINGFAVSNPLLFQALSTLANQSDALERATGVVLGAPSGGAAAPAPPPAHWLITANQGHFVIQITTPANATAPVQHQIRSALNQSFNLQASVNIYTLGYGECTRDIVDPNETRYWQLRSRYQGSSWNAWAAYATSYGVVALNAGALRTS